MHIIHKTKMRIHLKTYYILKGIRFRMKGIRVNEILKGIRVKLKVIKVNKILKGIRAFKY